jgi:hypothetical protein
MAKRIFVVRGESMAEIAAPASVRISRPLVLGAIAGGLLLAATLALWSHYGTVVFFEMIVSGIATCL